MRKIKKLITKLLKKAEHTLIYYTNFSRRKNIKKNRALKIKQKSGDKDALFLSKHKPMKRKKQNFSKYNSLNLAIEVILSNTTEQDMIYTLDFILGLKSIKKRKTIH